MPDKYFRLDALESDPVKLIEWLTDYGTQKMVYSCFDQQEQAFYTEKDGVIMVNGRLSLCYGLHFNTENTLLKMGVKVLTETE